MPRFNAAPSSVSMGIPVYDAGVYRLEVKSVTPFEGKPKDDGSDTPFGVRVVCALSGNGLSEKPYIANLYVHSEQALGFAKSFLCAAYGFPTNKEGEKAFNEASEDWDWSVDTDTKSLGEAWTNLVGRELDAVLDKKFDARGNEQQSAKYNAVL